MARWARENGIRRSLGDEDGDSKVTSDTATRATFGGSLSRPSGADSVLRSCPGAEAPGYYQSPLWGSEYDAYGPAEAVPFQNQFKMRHYSYSSVVVQFHDGADEILNHQGHEGSRRLLASDSSFVCLGGLGGSRFRKLHHYLPYAGLCFPNRRRIVVDENCCVVVSGLSKHTSGRKPTF